MHHNVIIKIFVSLLPLLVFFIPAEAFAMQVHGEPEGLYVHQMAHLHYTIALLFFFRDIRRARYSGTGWGYLLAFCLTMIVWNVLTFSGHLASYFLDPQAFAQDEFYLWTRLVDPLNFDKVIYYLATLDHLIYVPALGCLCLGLRSFYKSALHAPEDATR